MHVRMYVVTTYIIYANLWSYVFALKKYPCSIRLQYMS